MLAGLSLWIRIFSWDEFKRSDTRRLFLLADNISPTPLLRAEPHRNRRDAAAADGTASGGLLNPRKCRGALCDSAAYLVAADVHAMTHHVGSPAGRPEIKPSRSRKFL